jgi:hypothetical protein
MAVKILFDMIIVYKTPAPEKEFRFLFLINDYTKRE